MIHTNFERRGGGGRRLKPQVAKPEPDPMVVAIREAITQVDYENLFLKYVRILPKR